MVCTIVATPFIAATSALQTLCPASAPLINYLVNTIDFIPSAAGRHCWLRQYVTTVTYILSHMNVFTLFVVRMEATFKGS